MDKFVTIFHYVSFDHLYAAKTHQCSLTDSIIFWQESCWGLRNSYYISVLHVVTTLQFCKTEYTILGSLSLLKNVGLWDSSSYLANWVSIYGGQKGANKELRQEDSWLKFTAV